MLENQNPNLDSYIATLHWRMFLPYFISCVPDGGRKQHWQEHDGNAPSCIPAVGEFYHVRQPVLQKPAAKRKYKTLIQNAFILPFQRTRLIFKIFEVLKAYSCFYLQRYEMYNEINFHIGNANDKFQIK